MAPAPPPRALLESNDHHEIADAAATLVHKYRTGTKYVGDVVAGLDALASRAKFSAAAHLAAAAMRASSPVPRALWRWCVDNVEYLDEPACGLLFRAAAAHAGVSAMLRDQAHRIARNCDAVVAIAKRGTWLDWYADVAAEALRLRDTYFHYGHVAKRAVDELARRRTLALSPAGSACRGSGVSH